MGCRHSNQGSMVRPNTWPQENLHKHKTCDQLCYLRNWKIKQTLGGKKEPPDCGHILKMAKFIRSTCSSRILQSFYPWKQAQWPHGLCSGFWRTELDSHSHCTDKHSYFRHQRKMCCNKQVVLSREVFLQSEKYLSAPNNSVRKPPGILHL